MSQPHTVATINQQIAIEFNKLNDFMTLDSEKPAIASRIAELRAMLDEHEIQEPPLKNLRTLFVDFVAAFRKH